MPQRNRADERAEATESKFYLPGGYSPSFVASQLEELRARLFNHRVEISP